MNLCKDCKHYIEPRRCRHTNLGTDPVEGKPVSFAADELRKAGGWCGPEGRMWWAKDLPPPVLVEEARHDSRI